MANLLEEAARVDQAQQPSRQENHITTTTERANLPDFNKGKHTYDVGSSVQGLIKKANDRYTPKTSEIQAEMDRIKAACDGIINVKLRDAVKNLDFNADKADIKAVCKELVRECQKISRIGGKKYTWNRAAKATEAMDLGISYSDLVKARDGKLDLDAGALRDIVEKFEVQETKRLLCRDIVRECYKEAGNEVWNDAVAAAEKMGFCRSFSDLRKARDGEIAISAEEVLALHRQLREHRGELPEPEPEFKLELGPDANAVEGYFEGTPLEGKIDLSKVKSEPAQEKDRLALLKEALSQSREALENVASSASADAVRAQITESIIAIEKQIKHEERGNALRESLATSERLLQELDPSEPNSAAKEQIKASIELIKKLIEEHEKSQPDPKDSPEQEKDKLTQLKEALATSEEFLLSLGSDPAADAARAQVAVSIDGIKRAIRGEELDQSLKQLEKFIESYGDGPAADAARARFAPDIAELQRLIEEHNQSRPQPQTSPDPTQSQGPFPGTSGLVPFPEPMPDPVLTTRQTIEKLDETIKKLHEVFLDEHVTSDKGIEQLSQSIYSFQEQFVGVVLDQALDVAQEALLELDQIQNVDPEQIELARSRISVSMAKIQDELRASEKLGQTLDAEDRLKILRDATGVLKEIASEDLLSGETKADLTRHMRSIRKQHTCTGLHEGIKHAQKIYSQAETNQDMGQIIDDLKERLRNLL